MFSFSSYFNRQSLTLIGLIIILVSIPLTVFLGQKAQELRGRAAEGYTCNDSSGEFKYCMWFSAADGGSITAGKEVSVWVVGGQDDQSPRLEGTVNFTAASSSGPGLNCSKPDFRNCWKFVIPASQVTNQTYAETFKSEVSDQAGTAGRVASSFTPVITPQPTATPAPTQPPVAGGVDVADCPDSSISIDGQPLGSHPGIVVGNPYRVSMVLRNTLVSGVTTNLWGTDYSLRFLGSSETATALGFDIKRLDTNEKIMPGGQKEFTVTIKPRALPAGQASTKFPFKWQMHNGAGTPFGGLCQPELYVFTTLPGAPPGAPGACPTNVNPQWQCLVQVRGECTLDRNTPGSPDYSCPEGTGDCYFCAQVGPTATPTPTPTPETLVCAGTNVFCDSDVGVPRDPSQFNCQNLGRRACQAGTTCWRCSPITVTPTPTGLPPGAPTISPIPPGSTVIPIQVALQEFVKAPQTREGRVPASSRRSRADTEVRLVPTTGTPFNTKINLTWKEERVGPNLGFFEGNIVFPPNILPTGTYNILVKEPNHLRKTVATAVAITAGAQNPTVDGRNNPLTAGNVDGDNKIDVADVTMMVRCLAENVRRNLTDCSGREKDADVDGDGTVTIFDYNWIVENSDKEDEP